MKRILFVCRFNRFRSQFAEAYFNKINTNPEFVAKSAGLIKGRPLDIGLLALAKKNGLKLKGNSDGLSVPLLEWQDIIIIVADNVPKSIFVAYRIKTDKIIKWNIKDDTASLNIIKKRINHFLKQSTAHT